MNWRYFLLGIMMTAIPGSMLALSINSEPKVLSNNVVESPSPTPTESPIPSPTPSPTPKPTKTPNPTPSDTPVPIPPLSSEEETSGFIERFAGQYNVDPNVLRHIAVCESGFNPHAVNGAYIGLYQFGPITWQENRVLIGEDPDPILRYSAEESVQTAAFLLATRGRRFWPNCNP